MTPQEYKQARVALGHTQGRLAKLLGLRRETIARRESGKGEIHAEAALAIQSLRSGQQSQQIQEAAIKALKDPQWGAPAAREPLFGGMLKAPKQ